jgi:hypothetical protein
MISTEEKAKELTMAFYEVSAPDTGCIDKWGAAESAAICVRQTKIHLCGINSSAESLDYWNKVEEILNKINS